MCVLFFFILGKKQCIGCLVKSKYADQSDYIEFYLFENKTVLHTKFLPFYSVL